VFAFPDNLKPQRLLRRHDLGFWRVNGKLGHDRSHRRFGDKGVEGRAFGLQGVAAKSFEVETDGALHVAQGFLEGLALADHHALNPGRIGHIDRLP